MTYSADVEFGTCTEARIEFAACTEAHIEFATCTEAPKTEKPTEAPKREKSAETLETEKPLRRTMRSKSLHPEVFKISKSNSWFSMETSESYNVFYGCSLFTTKCVDIVVSITTYVEG